MARTKNSMLSFGIVATLGVISLASIAGVVACTLTAKDNQITSAALAALVSIGSSSAGAISGFLVTPHPNRKDEDDKE